MIDMKQARALEGEVATEGCRIGAMANQTVVVRFIGGLANCICQILI